MRYTIEPHFNAMVTFDDGIQFKRSGKWNIVDNETGDVVTTKRTKREAQSWADDHNNPEYHAMIARLKARSRTLKGTV